MYFPTPLTSIAWLRHCRGHAKSPERQSPTRQHENSTQVADNDYGQLAELLRQTSTVKYTRRFDFVFGYFTCYIGLPSHLTGVFSSLAVLDPRVGHTMDVLSPFISVLCHSDRLFLGESCPRLDVVHPGRAWSPSPACTWHCSLHYLFPRGVAKVC